jgi:hypothetical protein
MSSRSPSAAAKSRSSHRQAKNDRRESDRPGGIWREPVPMKPRRGLLVTLLVVFALWVVLLLTMYFTTLRRPDAPRRPQPPRATAPALAAR